jgi:hypothetical protein
VYAAGWPTVTGAVKRLFAGPAQNFFSAARSTSRIRKEWDQKDNRTRVVVDEAENLWDKMHKKIFCAQQRGNAAGAVIQVRKSRWVRGFWIRLGVWNPTPINFQGNRSACEDNARCCAVCRQGT